MLVAFSGMLSEASAASFYATEQLYFEGQYHECAEISRTEFERGVWNERWPELLMQCQLETGQYADARAVFETGLKRFGDRIAYRLIGVDVYQFNNQPLKAYEQMEEILRLVQKSPWRYGSNRDQITLGKYFSKRGEDSRQILELIYDPIKKKSPKYAEVYLATAELALDKLDYSLAAEQLQAAAELQPTNPHVFHLQALAFRESDGKRAAESLNKALELNPHHVPSLLMQVDQAIDAERYDDAEELLTSVLEINLQHPVAWAYHAVLAHLAGKFDAELKLRECGLWSFKSNPQVDFEIGRKLSQKYRFREAIEYQRLALATDSDYLPAKFQLANDLLRLGDDVEGWQLANDVHQRDKYHVEAFNLVRLKQQLDKYATLRSEHFVLRMETREAAIYGESVLRLLEEAHNEIVPKYEVQLEKPTQVEIFKRQEDFAIRTFGLPGGEGFLGVCFGPLITANSPESQSTTPTNWKSVLWHEFCHVVTLQKTNNRMPRWLSEGISVYEERQRDRSWGQSMTPQFKRMILDGELTPVSKLSGAFLRPPSGNHLQFAYFESSLVVEYLIQEHGIDVLRLILNDLGIGMPINETLERYVGSMQAIDEQFESYAIQAAKDYGSNLDWDTAQSIPDIELGQVLELLKVAPNNYWLLMSAAERQIARGDFHAARTHLEKIDENLTHDHDRTLPLLARVYRELDEPKLELEIYERWAECDADASVALKALVNQARKQDEWERMETFAEKLVSINPMLATSQVALAEASQRTGKSNSLIEANTALLQMEPADPASLHFSLAQTYFQRDQEELDRQRARRHVLQALELAPRYRDAQRLLLKIIQQESPPPETTDEASRGQSDSTSGAQ